MRNYILLKIKSVKKNRTLFLIFALLFITGVQGQTNWTLISQPGVNLIITNETTGYSYLNETVGSHGMKYTLKKSTDGFHSYATIRTKTGELGCYGLDEMFYINSDTGFIAELCQGNTSLYKTVDGGQTWTQTEFGGTYGSSMNFLNENNGYFSFFPGAGNDSYLIRNGTVVYTTKKYIFTKDNYPYPNHITKIEFLNDSTGFIICKDTLDNAVILKTSNFGSNWSEVKVLNNNLFKDISFISDSIGFVIGANGYILKTDDYGENWQTIDSNTSNDLNSIDFSNDSVGYIVGDDGLILKSQNNGLTWNQESFINTNDLIYTRSFNNGDLYINDANGNLYSNTINSVNIENINDNIFISPNPTKDIIHISIPAIIQNYNIELFNTQGVNLLSTTENEMNLSKLKSGVYLITIESDYGIYKTKIIKQ